MLGEEGGREREKLGEEEEEVEEEIKFFSPSFRSEQPTFWQIGFCPLPSFRKPLRLDERRRKNVAKSPKMLQAALVFFVVYPYGQVRAARSLHCYYFWGGDLTNVVLT